MGWLLYIYIYIYKINNSRVIKFRLDNYSIPPPPPLKNGRLTHVNPKLYIECRPWVGDGRSFDEERNSHN